MFFNTLKYCNFFNFQAIIQNFFFKPIIATIDQKLCHCVMTPPQFSEYKDRAHFIKFAKKTNSTHNCPTTVSIFCTHPLFSSSSGIDIQTHEYWLLIDIANPVRDLWASMISEHHSLRCSKNATCQQKRLV
jgi:hypothetical protein